MSTIVLDIETKFFGDERSLDEQEVAVAGIMDTDRGSVYEFFLQPELERLLDRLRVASTIVGHNILSFDYAVLEADSGRNVRSELEEKTVDTLETIKEEHGRRVSLDELADATLGRRKDVVATGVPALWRQGRVLEVLNRNRSDVELSRDVFEFGRDFGWVAAREENGVGFEQLEVDWR